MARQPKKRGVLYVVWNRGKSPKHDGALRRSIESVYKIHPELGMEIKELPPTSKLIDKARMYDLSPFEETLYLDLDTVVMDRLDFGFEKAVKHHIAVAICEAPYARRYAKMIQGDVIEYNTGVIFWKKGPEAERVFREWERLALAEDSSHHFPISLTETALCDCNDQAAFAKAIDSLGFNPFVLPLNWNMRPLWQKSAYGPCKVWHEYSEVPKAFAASSESMRNTNLMYFNWLRDE